MTCKPLPGGGFACGRAARRPSCSQAGCGESAARQCDWPLEGSRAGATCDRHLCAKHAEKIGANLDLCPAHANLHRARGGALPRQQLSLDAMLLESLQPCTCGTPPEYVHSGNLCMGCSRPKIPKELP